MKRFTCLVLSALLIMFNITGCATNETAAKALPLTISQEEWADAKQYVELSTGIKMAYVEMGDPDGPVVILQHGMTDNSRSWSLAAPYFAEAGYHVYLPDLRGMGKSDAADGYYTPITYATDLKAFFDAMNISKAILVGHSLGSYTVQCFSIMFPERCEKIVLVSSAPIKCYQNATLIPAYEETDDETLSVTMENATLADYENALISLSKYAEEPDPADCGIFIPSIPDLISNGLDKIGAADWLHGLIVDGIVAGLGAVLGFTPQILVLFFLLAFLESCGYMARIAFVLDRVFRKFGLSGKSFIPMLIGTGCGVPGIMATRTIENDRDRRMTVMTTTFIPCGANMPFIALIAGAVFNGSAWVATGSYFLGVIAIIISGIMLKKTKMFAGEPAPFVMELPSYHLPTFENLMRSTWERGWAFIKKEFTLILLSTIIIWFTTYFGVIDGVFRMLSEEEINHSILAFIGSCVAWLFAPLGWGTWQGAVASITGLVAKENIVATMGIFYGNQASIGAAFTAISGLSFLIFNLLCAPCFAAMGAIKGEMKSGKWTAFAILYQCGFAYIVALMVNQFGTAITGQVSVLGLIAAIAVLAGVIYMLVRPQKKYN